MTELRSRAQIYLEEWQAAGLEAGKFFPHTEAGRQDPFARDDTVSAQPPADGQIASAGHEFAVMLDKPGSDWDKHEVSSGQHLTITWSFHAPHKTRRWNYFLTRAEWDRNAPLARAQFEENPFHQVQLACQPFWSCDDLVPENPTIHDLRLPERAPGHHVMLSVWEIADTGHAFYQVIDLDFTR